LIEEESLACGGGSSSLLNLLKILFIVSNPSKKEEIKVRADEYTYQNISK
jgi:hypothetical protein